MSDPLRASPLLGELRRLFDAQDSLTLIPNPLLEMPIGSIDVDPTSAAAMIDIQDQIRVLIAEATDEDLVEASLETDGEPDAPGSETVLSEIERRNLKI